MALRVQILGATRLARVVVPYLLERRGARIVALDPGEEDESLPWFAPVRGLAREMLHELDALLTYNDPRNVYARMPYLLRIR